MNRSQSVSAAYSLCCPGSDAATLQVDFHLAGDRFVHTVRYLSGAGAVLGQWTAVQRNEAEQWPESPPIQELSLEPIGGRDVLLGVGRAGKCHWSVSVETAQIDDLPALIFDIACRCPEQPQWLGSTYRIDAAADGVLRTTSGGGGQSMPSGTAPAGRVLAIDCGDDASLRDDGDGQLTVEPIAKPPKWPGTIRWRYAIRVAGSGG